MDEKSASKLADEVFATYQRLRYPSGRPAANHFVALRTALEALPLPDATLVPTEAVDDMTDHVEALVLAGTHLFSVWVDLRGSEDEDPPIKITARRLPDDAVVSVRVVHPHEAREWQFQWAEDDVLHLTGTVKVDPRGPDDAELFTRKLAARLGWAEPPDPAP